MYKYEMDPASIAEDTEQTIMYTDRWMDGRTSFSIILKQHIQSDWITNEPRKPRGDALRTLSEDG